MSIEKLRQVFALESEDALQQMEDSLLNLEQHPNDKESINVLFRAAHTLKGSAGVVGLNAVSQFTHSVENYLQKVRNGELSLHVTAIRSLLACRDHISNLINLSIDSEQDELAPEVTHDGQTLLTELQRSFSDPAPAAATSPANQAEPSAVSKESKVNEEESPMQRLKNIFQQEMAHTIQQMQAAHHSLQLASQSAEDRRTDLSTLSRAAHTLKGSAGLINLNSISEFTAELENFFRSHEQTEQFSAEFFRWLGDVIQHLTHLLEALREGGAEAIEHNVLRQQSQQLLSRTPSLDQDFNTSDQVTVINADTPALDDNWHISLRFTQSALHHGVDPLASLRYLASQGEIIILSTLFDNMPNAAEMDPESCYLGFEIEFKTDLQSKDEIEALFDLIADQCDIHILPPHSRLAEYIQLIQALPEDTLRLGEILLEIGTLTHRELDEGLRLQTSLQTKPTHALSSDKSLETIPQRLGEILVDAGVVQPDVVNAALHKQQQAKDSQTRRQKTLQVDALKLDQLINLVGELVIANAGLNLQIQDETPDPVRQKEAASLMSRLVEDIRNRTLSMRMVPIGGTFTRFRRLVHDLSYELDKKIELVISGAETELDKTMVERINDPLMHLVRNAIDHGIEATEQRLALGKPEQGTVHLNAYHDSGSIVIEISDDGHGIDKAGIVKKAEEAGLITPGAHLTDEEIYELIFEPGLSTAKAITQISGRGVGLDVVKRNITALNGLINVDSELGEGSTFQIYLPLTLAIIDGFLLSVGGLSFVIPLDRIIECVEYSEAAEQVDRSGYFNLRGKVLPLLDVHELFGLPNLEQAKRNNIIVVHYGNQEAGLIVDQLMGEFQAVIKPLGKLFENLAGFSGATILGNGEVALILDVPALIQHHISKER